MISVPPDSFVILGFTHVLNLKLSTMWLPNNLFMIFVPFEIFETSASVTVVLKLNNSSTAVTRDSDLYPLVAYVIGICQNNLVHESLTWAVLKFCSSSTFEFESPSMKSIKDPVSLRAIKPAGSRIFIIISIQRIWNIPADIGSWKQWPRRTTKKFYMQSVDPWLLSQRQLFFYTSLLDK